MTTDAIKWEDATSYSQGQRGKIEPQSWRTTINGVSVWVSKGHRYYPDFWIMNCHALGMEEKRVGASSWDAENAQAEALRMASKAALAKAKALQIFAARAKMSEAENHPRQETSD